MGDLFRPATLRFVSENGQGTVAVRSLRLAVIMAINNFPIDKQQDLVIVSSDEELHIEQITELYNALKTPGPYVSQRSDCVRAT